MIDLFTQLLLKLNSLLANNLGLTIIVIGVLSRLIFYPFFASQTRYSRALRELKPQLDQIKKRYGSDMRRVATEQSQLLREAGVNPAAGAVSCLGLFFQLAIFFLLFQSLRQIITSGLDTNFLFWNLAKPDVYSVQGVPVPGILVLTTAIFSFLQGKMAMPETPQLQKTSRKDEQDLASALATSQGQLIYLFPLLMLIWGVKLSAGLMLYWLASTIFGIIQQYQLTGFGGLKPWKESLTRKK